MNIEQAKVICRVPEQQKLALDLNMQGWLKYLSEDQFLEEKLELFKILELDKRKNQKILDIGAGLGHFGSISKHHGHSYLGTYFGRTDRELRPFYHDAGLDLTECKLFPNYDKTIPEGPWDCIIMIRTTFELNAEWTVDDWKELVNNCMKNLNSGGQLLIKSNLSVERRSKYGKLETQCQDIMLTAFSEKSPLPYWQWATWHWIKE
jgi:hypothetical protein